MTINHKQLGFTIASLDGDAGILRITGTLPSARSCGVSEGELLLAVDGTPVQVPFTVAGFAAVADSKPRPLSLTLFRCANFRGMPKIPQHMCLSGYLAKKSRT